ncbi:MAG TPA: hypothetical protein VJ484_02750 [Lysobacter sp.]|nr:hypothetical protein [Lysobacter sp.]
MNDNFEFILGLYSIIAGLGVSRLLEGVKDAVIAGRATRTYWVHSAMVMAGLAVHATTWLSLWALRTIPVWEIWNFLFVLLVPVLLYLFSSLVFPEEGDDWDLRAYYYAHARRIHGLLASAIAVNAMSEYALLRQVEIPALAAMRVGMVVALCACAIWKTNEPLHRIVVPLLLLIGAATLAVLDVEIQ